MTRRAVELAGLAVLGYAAGGVVRGSVWWVWLGLGIITGALAIIWVAMWHERDERVERLDREYAERERADERVRDWIEGS